MDITLMDGATGTRLWALAEAAGFERTPTWRYNLEHPELVEQVTREYIAAGSELVCANSFAVNAVELERHAPAPPVEEVAAAAVRLAKRAAAGSGAQVALDIGQMPALLEPCGPMTPERARACYAQVLAGGLAEGPDVVLFETFTDLRQLQVAVEAAQGCGLPVLCSLTFDRSGNTMMGDSPAAIAAALEPMGVAALGLNCSFGPAAAIPVIRELAAHTTLPLILKPNVDCGPADFAAALTEALPLLHGGYLGACCGSDPDYIRELKAVLGAGQCGE